MRGRLSRPFAPFAVPNYRRFYAGQAFARCGAWVQTVAELWLVLSLTGSGVSLGLTTAFQFLPMLLLGAWAGLLADRLPKRRILLAAQAWLVEPVGTLLVLTATGTVELWMVYVLVFARGVGRALDNPVRQSFV
ncbi:MAG: MFS transporter, partial [Thermoleophilaceae bacterium]